MNTLEFKNVNIIITRAQKLPRFVKNLDRPEIETYETNNICYLDGKPANQKVYVTAPTNRVVRNGFA